MHYIRRLPLLLALLAAILSGIAGHIRSMTTDKILLLMIVTMVVFYCIGFFVRYNLMKIYDQIKEKREKESINEEPEDEKTSIEKSIERKEEEMENIIDAFEPLKVSKFIREELKQSDKQT